MTTVQRKEYQESKVIRTVSPVRNFRSSAQNLTEFDNNLDHLLEDLQNTVSRPGSSLGTHRDAARTLDSSFRSNSLNRFNNGKTSNPLTEYSSDDAYNYTSPDGRKHVTGYKKESYSYKTSGGQHQPEKIRTQNSINQLDSLLDDLQQVKSSAFLEKESYNTIGTTPDSHKSRRSAQRELHYGDTPRSTSLTRDMTYSSEGTYGDLRPIRGPSPSPSSRTSTLSKQTKVTNMHSYPVEVVETTTPDINPEILAHLDPNLHPPGNTKVTTTIKTYTYEIPGAGGYPTALDTTSSSTDKSYVYSPNQTTSTPSKSFVYKGVDQNDNSNAENYGWQNKVYKETTSSDRKVYQKPAPPTYVKETITTRNYQPEITPTTNQTYHYNETTTTRNVDEIPRSRPRHETSYIVNESHRNKYPAPPPPTTTTYIQEIHDTTNIQKYPEPYRPPTQTTYVKEPPTDNKTYIYKHETHTTSNNYPGSRPKPTEIETFDPKHPPYGAQRPGEPLNIQYRYKSEHTTTNNYKSDYPTRVDEDSQPLLPNRFPHDGPDGPPKKLDELMATIGHGPPNSPYNAGYNAHEEDAVNQRKIDTLKKQQEDAENLLQKKEQPRSKNVAGPPVYYPPGHEMFARKEEGGGWQAEGGYEKASGKYKYEAESKSKSKSSGGTAIVPVCLPLCCGLPCAII